MKAESSRLKAQCFHPPCLNFSVTFSMETSGTFVRGVLGKTIARIGIGPSELLDRINHF